MQKQHVSQVNKDLLVHNHVSLFNLIVQDKDGNRAIHHASLVDEAGVVELLIKGGE